MHASFATGDALWEARGRRFSIARVRGDIMIVVALPLIAVLFGADPQFVGGVILSMLAMAAAGYAMAQLMWDALS
jgi:hypothetical protein